MARQVLENGVILPAEYSDDWYDDMTSNLTKLDDVIGSDSEKLSSADVGAAALSNNYNDLDNLPTIPTVNDATLTIQKNGVDVQTFTANASSNVTANITVPTKTSDLTNDSNFVDTSNSAVASGITSAKVTSYDSHIADTDIHVTTADKNKWNNQTYVFRYSSTALVASSTNSNTLLDNTDNLKVGDKVIDSDGVLFSITAIDTANSTFTIGTALIDLAQDSDVVHKSGDETVAGIKTFTDSMQFRSNVAEYGVTNGNIQFYLMDKNNVGLSKINQGVYNNGVSYITLQLYGRDSNNQTVTNTITYQYSSYLDKTYLLPTDTKVYLGSIDKRWGKIYGIQYYYGSNNVEFSTKFVTTDTAQTISGNKVWTGTNIFQQNVTYQRTNFFHQSANPSYILKDTELEKGSLATTHASYPGLWQDRNGNILGYVRFVEYSSGRQTAEFKVSNLIKNGALDPTGSEVNCTVLLELQPSGEKSLIPEQNNDINLGTSTNKWKGINGVEPSSLSLPDLSNAVDISSYITDLAGNPNAYSPPANGYIILRSTTANVLGIVENTSGMGSYSRGTNQTLAVNLPVVKNSSITIYAVCSSLSQAKFIPCQGNV